jgi:hypothetical protein
MKVENHDTTKLESQHENLLKREIHRWIACLQDIYLYYKKTCTIISILRYIYIYTIKQN